jgi:acyl-CoA synthetase (AMP-forming)/AMP-acid ligase II
MTDWNLADVWEAVAATLPDSLSLACGDVHLTWSEVDRRANGVAAALAALGLDHQAKVAQYLYNGTEYLESIFAAFKVGLVPVNTNYRYTAGELVYLWTNADVRAVVFHGEFTARIEAIRPEVPDVVGWLWVDDGTGPCPEWAQPYEVAASSGATPPEVARSGDDLFLLYTGGTTGMPKGVMWRQDDIFCVFNAHAPRRFDEDGTMADYVAKLDGPGPVHIPACPLMHGTGIFSAMNAWDQGGANVILPSRRFDAVELLDAVARERVQTMAIVGDPFARPMLDALDAEPDRWDISSLDYVMSSGVAWSEEVKEGLLGHHDAILLVDSYGSSEAINVGRSVKRKGVEKPRAQFSVGERVKVLDDEGRPVEAGSGQQGRVAIAGRGPIGYYKDPEKSAATFPVYDGVRYTIPGDFATVEADGKMNMLGRGSACINTAGEKVYPEEVEAALKRHPAVRDAAVVGVPDPRFTEAVAALVELEDGAIVEVDALVGSVKDQLAGYKAPRHVVFGPIGRAANGKLDYPGIKERVQDAL